MRVLITGASGWIGANLVGGFTSAGHEVVAVVRPDSPRAAKLDQFTCQTAFVDLADHARLKTLVEDCDVVLHNGAVGPYEVIVGSTVALLEAVKDRYPRLRRFIFISSTVLYEGTAYRPFVPISEEEADWRLSSSYAVGKLCGEAYVRLYHRLHSVPTISLRFPAVVGGKALVDPGGVFFTRPRLETLRQPGFEGRSWRDAARQLERMLSENRELCIPANPTGEAWKRHWVDVRDCVRACLLASQADTAAAERANGESINIMSEPLEWDVAVKRLSSLSGLRYGEVEWPEPYFYEFSLKRAEYLLGYRPAYNSQSMIEDAWRHSQGEEVGIVPSH